MVTFAIFWGTLREFDNAGPLDQIKNVAYEGISIRPFWTGLFFVLSIASAIFIWFRGLALIPLTFTGLTAMAIFWGAERRTGPLGWAFAGVLAIFAVFYSWIFVTDLLPRDIWSCERQIRKGLDNPQSYQRIAVETVETESLPEVSVWTIRYKFEKNNLQKIGEVDCHSERLQEDVASIIDGR